MAKFSGKNPTIAEGRALIACMMGIEDLDQISRTYVIIAAHKCESGDGWHPAIFTSIKDRDMLIDFINQCIDIAL
jgi:hypothetical protein